MADIFISYAREDRAEVQRLVTALEAAGLSCWWDRQLAAGTRFLEETERELNAAKAVLVVWTQHSVGSHWVHDEAGIGRDSGRLAPISLDGTMPPLGFRQFQVIDFAPWAKGDESPIQELIAALSRFAPEAEISKTARPAPRRGKWRVDPRILAAVSAMLVVIAAWFVWGALTPPHKEVEPQLAVLKFQNIGEPQPYFAEGMADELAAELSRIKGLTVLARSSSFALQTDQASAAGAAKTLGATLILGGTVRKTGDKVRVAVQLAEAPSGRQVWAETFERPAAEAFSLQRDIAVNIARLLNARTDTVPPSKINPQAYGLYLEGRIRYMNAADRDAFIAARDLFKAAIELEPDFARAWAGLGAIEADLMFNENFYGGEAPTPERSKLAMDAVERAIALDPAHYENYDSMACIFVTLGRWKDALDAYNLASEKGGYGGDWLFFSMMGFKADSLAEAKDSTRRDPLAARNWTNLASLCADIADRKCQIDSATRARELDPEGVVANGYGYLALIATKDFDGARKLVKEHKEPVEGFLEMNAPFSVDYFVWLAGDGPPVPAWKILDAVKDGSGYVDTSTEMLVNMKQWDAAAQLLEQWGPTTRPAMAYLYRADWAPLRARPEYWRLMEREGLVPFWRETGKWPDFCREDSICKQHIGAEPLRAER